ncbi:putative reverse transcriptase domain-containing protein [Tanacetum coccineum]|uniref:Reverse transcriptase domain-containing protein n=1 Tax=Tanacetum coccineum TaxID=301880 RepID=A0ABQ5BA54_9ASTR
MFSIKEIEGQVGEKAIVDDKILQDFPGYYLKICRVFQRIVKGNSKIDLVLVCTVAPRHLIDWSFRNERNVRAMQELSTRASFKTQFLTLGSSSLVQFLSHVIDSQGIHVDPAKIDSIKDWASPKTTEIPHNLSLPQGAEKFNGLLPVGHIKVWRAGVDAQTRSAVGFALKFMRIPSCSVTYDYEIRLLFTSRRQMVVAASLSRKEGELNIKTEAQKPENLKNEDVGEKTDSRTKLASVSNIKEVVTRHGIPVSIICDRDPRFASHFWRSLQKALGTSLDMSTAYHPKTDGQNARTIQTLEDMLRACVIGFRNSWINHLPLVEFSYNNSYHASIKAAPFEALYGRKCRSPVCWAEVGEAQLTGPDLIQETTEKIIQIKQRIQAARDRQKSYANLKCKPMEFQVGDRVMLKVLERWGRVGSVAYKLELPQELSRVHNTFHVSNLKKCYSDEPLAIPLEGLHIDDKLQFVEEPIKIMKREIK